MKLNKMTTFSYDRSAGGSVQHNTSHGIFNGLIFSYPSTGDNDVITVKIRGEKGLIPVCTKMPLRALQELSDYYFGTVGLGASRQMEKAFESLLADSVITAGQLTNLKASVSAGGGEYGLYSFCLPLGNIYLNGKYEIDIQIDFEAKGSGSVMNMDVITYQQDMGPAFINTYDISTDKETDIRGAKDIFLMASDITKRLNQDIKAVDVQMNYEFEDSAIFSLSHAFWAYRLFGSFESDPYGVLTHLHSNESSLPQDIHLKLTGTDASKVSILTVREHYELKSVADNTNRELDKTIRLTQKAERDDPEGTKAKRFAGVAVKSEVLEEVKEESTKITK